MSRRKQHNRLLTAARTYLKQHQPALRHAPLAMRMLDGPPSSPRYAVTVEACCAHACPHGFPATVAAAGQCGVRDCALRRTMRLLLDRGGGVMQVTESGIHWS